jgi:hypothetical protein
MGKYPKANPRHVTLIFPAYDFGTMKNIRALRVGAPACMPPECPSKSTASRIPAIRAIIVTFVILTQSQGMVLDSEAQTLLNPGHESQAAPTQPSSLSSLAAQGRRHPSYQVFAGGLALPSIIVLDQATLEVGGRMKIDVSRLDQLTAQQKEALADWYAVPAGVVDRFQENFAHEGASDATRVATKFRIMVIDYKYLLDFWTKYLPAAGNEKIKSDALQALRVGDLDKAWKMFLDLPRLEPPLGLRIVDRN